MTPDEIATLRRLPPSALTLAQMDALLDAAERWMTVEPTLRALLDGALGASRETWREALRMVLDGDASGQAEPDPLADVPPEAVAAYIDRVKAADTPRRSVPLAIDLARCGPEIATLLRAHRDDVPPAKRPRIRLNLGEGWEDFVAVVDHIEGGDLWARPDVREVRVVFREVLPERRPDLPPAGDTWTTEPCWLYTSAPDAPADPLRVWRVFNGWEGNGGIHRIVVARSAEAAIEVVKAAGMRPTEPPMWEADLACDAAEGACEGRDQDL